MSEKIKNKIYPVVKVSVLLLFALCWSCTKAQNTPDVVEKPENMGAPNEPEFSVGNFTVLDKAKTELPFPYLQKTDGAVVENCYVPVKNLTVWQTQSTKIKDFLSLNEADITKSVLSWLSSEIFPKEEDLFADTSMWKIKIYDPQIGHVFPTEMRLSEEGNCIDDAIRGFPADSTSLTTAIGADEITFVAETPVPSARLRAMREVAVKKKLRVIMVNSYSPALDDNGKQKLGPKKEKLFNSPSGTLIREKDIPLPKFREVVEWKLAASSPIYFATGDLPKTYWKKVSYPLLNKDEADSKKKKDDSKTSLTAVCEVHLIYGEAAPRATNCQDTAAVGFGVDKSKTEGNLTVKAAVNSDIAVKEMTFEQTSSMTVGGNIVLWITPFPAVEGARLTVEYMMLDIYDKIATPKSFAVSSDKPNKVTKTP